MAVHLGCTPPPPSLSLSLSHTIATPYVVSTLKAVTVVCTFGWSHPATVNHADHAAHTNNHIAANARTITLAPVTKYPSKGKMVIYDTHLLDEAIEATFCEFKIEHRTADILLAEIEVYE
jgi:hypothetical protein